MTDDHVTGEHADDRSGGQTGQRDGRGPFLDAVFGALADWRRREIVQYFRDTAADTASVDELAFLLEAYEPDGSGGGSRPHEEIVAELEADHLPSLAAVGIVDVDARSRTVRYRGQPTVEKWLEHARAVDGRQG